VETREVGVAFRRQMSIEHLTGNEHFEENHVMLFSLRSLAVEIDLKNFILRSRSGMLWEKDELSWLLENAILETANMNA
jgi:hypothetical protein